MNNKYDFFKTEIFAKNVEKNGRYIGKYQFQLNGDFGIKPTASPYHSLCLNIINKIAENSSFEVGDTINLTISKEFDFWKRFELVATSSSKEELFRLEWIVGCNVLKNGEIKERILSPNGIKEYGLIKTARKLNILCPKGEERNIVLFHTIYRNPKSYSSRPLVSKILSLIEDAFSKKNSLRNYKQSLFILDLQNIVEASPYIQPIDKIHDFYVKHGYCPAKSSSSRFLLKSIPDECPVKESVDVKSDLKDKGDNFAMSLFKWGDIIEIVDNGRNFLCSALSVEEFEKVKAGFRGFVLCDEKKEDCGMITCSFEQIKSLYIKIHYSNLKKVSQLK